MTQCGTHCGKPIKLNVRVVESSVTENRITFRIPFFSSLSLTNSRMIHVIVTSLRRWWVYACALLATTFVHWICRVHHECSLLYARRSPDFHFIFVFHVETYANRQHYFCNFPDFAHAIKLGFSINYVLERALRQRWWWCTMQSTEHRQVYQMRWVLQINSKQIWREMTQRVVRTHSIKPLAMGLLLESQTTFNISG